MTIPDAIEELKRRDQWVAYSRAKIPVSPRGMMASTTDPTTWGSLEEAKFIRGVQGLPGVGFVFCDQDPYVGVDLDDAVDPSSGELRPWAREIVEELDSYTEFSPSGLGVHVWCRGEIPRAGARRDDGGKIEVYQSKRYFTVTGRHLAGTPTTIEARDMSAFYASRFGSAERKKSSGDLASLELPIWEARDTAIWIQGALDHIPAEDYHDWIRVGMALKAELGEAGWSYFDAWSASSSKYQGPEKTARKWRSFDADGEITIGTVVWLAEQNGWTMPPRGPQIPPSIDRDWEVWLASQQAPDAPAEMNTGLGFEIMDLADLYLDDSPYEPDLIGPGVLGPGDIMLLFGPPKSMKSMACLDMFRAFALGESWLGLEPARPLKTLYAQFEVKRDAMRKRAKLAQLTPAEIEALRGRFMVTGRFTPVLTADFVADFSEAALRKFGGELDVLILDPLANIFTGDSENDNTQMSRFLRQIKYLRNAISPNVAIVLVHHANKTGRDDRHADPFTSIRGASSLRGAYDAGMFLDRLDETSGLLRAFWELRNGPAIAPKTLAFEQGRFVEVVADGASGAPVHADLGALIEDDPARDAIVSTLCDEARRGRFYAMNTFAEAFHGHPVLGSSGTIRRHLKRLATRGVIGFFNRVGGEPLPELHHLSAGYLCARGMILNLDGAAHIVRPDKIRDPSSGHYVDCDSWPEDY